MSIKLVVTRGYGNGTFSGTIKDVTLRGYSIGAEAARTANYSGRAGLRPLYSGKVGLREYMAGKAKLRG